MSGPYAGPGREAHQSGCPLTPGRDLSRHPDHKLGLTMSAAASSLKHASVYGFGQREHPLPSSSYSPLRRLQHLTTMVSQPDLVLPAREPDRTWDWGSHKNEKGKERDPWADRGDYSGNQNTSREERFGNLSAGQNQHEVQGGRREAPAAACVDHAASDKKTEGCFSGPPSPAFSLDSNSPFTNGFLHFESSLFEDDDNDEERGASSPVGDLKDQPERAVLLSTPGDLNSDSKDALVSAKVITRSQSSGQRRRYWECSEDEWESGAELFLFEDSPSRPSMASFIFITLNSAQTTCCSLIL